MLHNLIRIDRGRKHKANNRGENTKNIHAYVNKIRKNSKQIVGSKLNYVNGKIRYEQNKQKLKKTGRMNRSKKVKTL